MPSTFEGVEINNLEDLENLIDDVEAKLHVLSDAVDASLDNVAQILEGVGIDENTIEQFLTDNVSGLSDAIDFLNDTANGLQTVLSDAEAAASAAIDAFANSNSVSSENLQDILSDDVDLAASEDLLEDIEADFNALVAQITGIYTDARDDIEATIPAVTAAVENVEVPEDLGQNFLTLLSSVPGGLAVIPQLAAEAASIEGVLSDCAEDLSALSDLQVPGEVLVEPLLAEIDGLVVETDLVTLSASVGGTGNARTISLDLDYEGTSFLRGSITLSIDPIADPEHVIDLGGDLNLYITSDISPIAKNVDLGEMDEDGSITFTEADLLAQSIDFDGDDLSVSSVSVDPSVGTITDNGDGTYTFTPAADLTGDDFEIAFTVTDGVYEDGAIARIDINPVSDVPTNGDDVLIGTDGNDCINGLGGDDVIYGLGGNDYLNGGSGNDTLFGGDGNDYLYGSYGNDTLVGGEGADYLHGGYGFDTVDYSGSSEGVAVLLQSTGCYTLDSDYNYTWAGGYGGEAQGDRYCSIEAVIGSEFDDFVYGGRYGTTADLGAGDDIFDTNYYSIGHDVVDGGDGNDIIRTGRGSDEIDGGAGDDILIGGSGRDTFIFGEDSGNDTIKDFSTHWYYGDSISLEGFDSFDEVLDAATQSGSYYHASTTIDLGDGNSVTLEGVRISQLDADMFGFDDGHDYGGWGC